MKCFLLTFVTFVVSLVLTANPHGSSAQADEPQREGAWLHEHEKDGAFIFTRELTLHPSAEPKPALKYQFIPDDFHLLDGNAAIYYLKALGFLEQSRARDLLSESLAKARKLADEEGTDVSNLPPYAWQSMAPQELPIEALKQHLSLTAFQPPFLAEATRRRSFSLDRNLREVEDPISYLLPEIQAMRDLARTQSLRCRLAIAEHRIDDAIAILGQQFAMAHHLATDEFLVSNLVGAAITNIAWDDALYLVEEPDSPNLYWAIASLPKPFIDMRRSLATERQFLFEQVKQLREVDETPRNASYWQDFIDRILPQLKSLGVTDFGMASDDPEIARAGLVTFVALAYPGAKRFLLEESHLNRAQVEAYPTAQTVFLATKRYYEQTADNQFKWFNIPFEQAVQNERFQGTDANTQTTNQRLGWPSLPTGLLLPAIQAVRNAQQRDQQRLAYLQTIEALRMYSFDNAGKLPSSLDELPYPAAADPYTGKGFSYEFKDDHALLTGQSSASLRYRFIIRSARIQP